MSEPLTSPLTAPPLTTPPVALAIAAHPDDVEFWCGATLARWAEDGCVIHHLICTDGSKGTWDPSADTAALVTTRQKEQRDAARRLGATGTVTFLGRVDGELTADRATIAEVCEVIRTVRPTVVLAHDPWKRYRLHPDHRAAGFVAVDAVVAARDPHFFAEQSVPHHRPEALMLFEADVANHAEPTTEAAVVAKIDALEAHVSQLQTTHFYDLDTTTDERRAFRQRERDKMARAAAQFGLDSAEVFHLIDEL